MVLFSSLSEAGADVPTSSLDSDWFKPPLVRAASTKLGAWQDGFVLLKNLQESKDKGRKAKTLTRKEEERKT